MFTKEKQPESAKLTAQYLQNSETGRFQDFIPFDEWQNGERESNLVDYSNMDKIPLVFLAHKNDEACSYEETLKIVDQAKSPIDIHVFETDVGEDMYNHVWTAGGNYEEDYFNQLKKALQD